MYFQNDCIYKKKAFLYDKLLFTKSTIVLETMETGNRDGSKQRRYTRFYYNI